MPAPRHCLSPWPDWALTGPVKSLSVIYYRNGKLHKVKAKHVIMACGQWVNRLVCKDLPPEYQEAMATFHHAPMHTINVALRNWKFLEKLGAARGSLV